MIETDIFIRLLLALVLGGFIGLERIHAGKNAGIRTLALVSLGAALFVIISEYVVTLYDFPVDPLRVLANVVVGVGFLGAGMIIFQKDHVANLTTAAGVWISAAIGSAVGFGMYGIAITVTILVIFTYTLLWNVENFLKRKFPPRQ